VKYLSVCSGIEAASVAWHPLGWEPLAFSEIEAFPRAVLAHHYPDVPLHGDFTVLRDQDWIVDADVLVGGTPCQAFSVAGLRNSLSDERGNLSLEFVRLADAIDDLRTARGRDAAIIVWENVPGVLSVKDNAFGCFLAGLAGDVDPYVPPRGKWTNAGVVAGPQRTVAWRVLDAQYFGLAQRRRRVFVVASARAGFDPAAVLLEFEGLRRDTPPRREKGQVAPTIPSRSTAGGGLGTDFDCDGGVIQQPVVMAHGQANAEIRTDGGTPLVPVIPFDTTQITSPSNYSQPKEGDPCHPLAAGAHPPAVAVSLKGEGFDASTQFGDIAGSLTARHDSSPCADRGMNVVVHAVQSEDGTGRDKPLVPVNAYGFYQNQGSHGSGDNRELSPTLKAADSNNLAAVAVSLRGRDGGGTAELGGDIQNALRASQGGGDKPHVLAATFQQSSMKGKGTIGYDDSGVAKPVKTQMDGQMLHQHMAVRRLTPKEAERLQGFPDGYTMIPWKKKPADQCPDGPRYKALGNSMAVPVMRWIGTRIKKHLGGEL